MGYDYYYERKERIHVQGGIKAQGGKKALGGDRWWAKRWIDILKSFNMGARLTRGATYARSGQVLDIVISGGRVDARVQGSRKTPYSVVIEIAPISPEKWDRVIPKLSGQAHYAALLLSGEMPEDIENVFNEAKCPLFPDSERCMESDCTCPDWANPCKHIAAVYYIMGEEFDRDPFLIFTLRGMTREELLAKMGLIPAAGPDDFSLIAYPSDPLPDNPREFWKGGTVSASLPADTLVQPAISASLLRRLGVFPLWKGSYSVFNTLETVYREASKIGLRIASGENISDACESESMKLSDE